MNDRWLRWLFVPYPRAWKERYLREMRLLTEDLWLSGEATGARLALSVLSGGIVERARSTVFRARRSAVLPVAAAMVLGAGLLAMAVHRSPSRLHAAAAVTTAGTVPLSAGRSFAARRSNRLVDVPAPLVKLVDGKGGVLGAVPGGDLVGLHGAAAARGGVPALLGSPMPVYAITRAGVVGRVYPGTGFVPRAGTAPPGGAAGVTLPELTGTLTPAATARISSLGLAADVVNAHCGGTAPAEIGQMSPPAGSIVPSGSLVTLTNCT